MEDRKIKIKTETETNKKWSKLKPIINRKNIGQIILVIIFNENSLNIANKDPDEIVRVNLSRVIVEKLLSRGNSLI